MLDRAYALLSIKALDGPRRTITGLASTPTPDRHGDILEPLGATFRNPLPLLLYHDRARPIGRATLTARRDGIAFEATLPEITTPGTVRDRVDEAWHSIQAGLMTGVSIGFRPIGGADGVKALPSGGMHLLRTEICELSLVTVPANVETTIHTIKSLDLPHLAASGLTLPGVAGRTSTRPTMAKPTTAEHIQNLENKRAALTARMSEILQSGADDGATLAPDQAEEHDGLAVQVKNLEADLVRWREMEQIQIKTATVVPITAPTLRLNSYTGQVSVRPNVAPGTAFVRMACAKLLERSGQVRDASEYAKRWDDSTPEVSLFLKAAVAPGTITDATWAAPLVNQNISNEFIELLRPATILGKIPNLRTIPFNTKVPAQSAGGSYGWVGEAKPKPVTKLAFTSTSLSITKVAGIIVLTQELIKLSNPSAEALVRNDMIKGIAAYLDQQLTDPAVAAVAGVNPASITNGAPTAAATTNPMADIMGLISHFSSNNIPVDGVVFIMSAANALALSFRSNLDGSPQYPGVTINGGSYKGLTFITSNAVGTNVIALQPDLILYADDGGVTIDASQEASLQMDSAPASPADATTVFVSLWQTNTVGLRAERFVNWQKANANAVKYLTATAWPAPTGGVMAADAPTVRNGKA